MPPYPPQPGALTGRWESSRPPQQWPAQQQLHPRPLPLGTSPTAAPAQPAMCLLRTHLYVIVWRIYEVITADGRCNTCDRESRKHTESSCTDCQPACRTPDVTAAAMTTSSSCRSCGRRLLLPASVPPARSLTPGSSRPPIFRHRSAMGATTVRSSNSSASCPPKILCQLTQELNSGQAA